MTTYHKPAKVRQGGDSHHTRGVVGSGRKVSPYLADIDLFLAPVLCCIALIVRENESPYVKLELKVKI